jgi:hydroxymethylpyrimidine/phosphomethylpyrimidine kinase
MKKILSIAGSDSGAGAGIQADIKAAAYFGVHCATAITAITAQNTLGVQDYEEVSTNLIHAQINSVMSDLKPEVIKTGMLAVRKLLKQSQISSQITKI